MFSLLLLANVVMYDYHKLIHISIVTMFYLLNFSTLHANAYEALGQENDINRHTINCTFIMLYFSNTIGKLLINVAPSSP